MRLSVSPAPLPCCSRRSDLRHSSPARPKQSGRSSPWPTAHRDERQKRIDGSSSTDPLNPLCPADRHALRLHQVERPASAPGCTDCVPGCPTPPHAVRVHHRQGAEAELRYRREFPINDANHGSDHPAVAISLGLKLRYWTPPSACRGGAADMVFCK